MLTDVSFNMEDGEIVGLIGPNGAGKTTLFNVITGIYPPNKGAIRFHGKNLAGLKPHQICRRGISRTFQLVRVFPSMTAIENVLVGAIYSKRGRRKQFLNQALECLEILNLTEIKDTVSVHLTHSDRRLVETASALASQPTLALLDEPLAGLNPTEVEKILKIIKEIRDRRGISILWIEHKIDADRDNFHPGVWVNGDEIAAIGLSIKKWVSMHGFALNMNTDLKYFFVHPCGFSDRRATSMSKILGYNVPMEGVTNRLIFHFYDIFNFPKIIHSNLYSSIL